MIQEKPNQLRKLEYLKASLTSIGNGGNIEPDEVKDYLASFKEICEDLSEAYPEDKEFAGFFDKYLQAEYLFNPLAVPVYLKELAKDIAALYAKAFKLFLENIGYGNQEQEENEPDEVFDFDENLVGYKSTAAANSEKRNAQDRPKERFASNIVMVKASPSNYDAYSKAVEKRAEMNFEMSSLQEGYGQMSR